MVLGFVSALRVIRTNRLIGNLLETEPVLFAGAIGGDDGTMLAAVRRFVARVGEDNLADVYALRRADTYGTTGVMPPPETGSPLADRVDRVLAAGRALSIRDLAVTGDDLAAIGIERGRRMGLLLKELLETVLDDPEMNEKDRLLTVVRKFEERRETGGS